MLFAHLIGCSPCLFIRSKIRMSGFVLKTRRESSGKFGKFTPALRICRRMSQKLPEKMDFRVDLPSGTRPNCSGRAVRFQLRNGHTGMTPHAWDAVRHFHRNSCSGGRPKRIPPHVTPASSRTDFIVPLRSIGKPILMVYKCSPMNRSKCSIRGGRDRAACRVRKSESRRSSQGIRIHEDSRIQI